MTYGASNGDEATERHLELVLSCPPVHPHDQVTVRLTESGQGSPESYVIARGGVLTIRRALLPEGGVLQVASDTVFQPAAHGMGNDSRMISCLCDACRIVTPLDAQELLEDRS